MVYKERLDWDKVAVNPETPLTQRTGFYSLEPRVEKGLSRFTNPENVVRVGFFLLAGGIATLIQYIKNS